MPTACLQGIGHKHQQYNKTDYLSTVAHGWPQLYRKDLLLLISSSYSLTFKTTQVFISAHDATLSTYAAHAYCTHKSTHASTHTNRNTHARIPCTHQYPSTWAWSPAVDLFCLYRGHITFLTIHCIIYKNNYMSIHTYHTCNKACFHLTHNLLWMVGFMQCIQQIYFCVSIF